MSIIKRKAGSEDIVKSVLEFDDVPTEGSHNLVESGAVAKAIGNLGQPLQWKGPATVAQLNAGITGILEGWTYTLTDAGTLTDGSIEVEIGDEVAWTGTAWFKVGGDSGKVAVFECRDNGSDQNFFTGPTYAELETARTAGKTIVLLVHYGFDTIVDRYFEMTNYSYGRDAFTYQFTEAKGGRVMQFSGTVGDVEHHAWSKASAYDSSLSSTSTNAVQNKTLYATIGSIKNGGALTDAASVNVPNNSLSTLTTSQATLKLNVTVNDDEVPNFAVEVTPSVDVTLTVTKQFGNTTTTLSPSVSGGNSLTAGKHYQVTCVGSCWTLAEFAMPSP